MAEKFCFRISLCGIASVVSEGWRLSGLVSQEPPGVHERTVVSV